MDIFRRAADHRGWDLGDDPSPGDVADKEAARHIWNILMRQLHEPFSILSEAIDQGLEHAALQLELLPRPKANKASSSNGATAAEADVEDRGDLVKPGEPGFARVIDDKVLRFYSTRSETLKLWARERGLTEGTDVTRSSIAGLSGKKKEQRQAQLYVLLYLEQLVSLFILQYRPSSLKCLSQILDIIDACHRRGGPGSCGIRRQESRRRNNEQEPSAASYPSPTAEMVRQRLQRRGLHGDGVA